QISRAQLILRTGRAVPGVALYTDRLGYPDDSSGDPAVNHQIERSGLNYDYVNQNLLQSATSANGQLIIGPNSYSALILDHVTQIAPRTAQLIEQLSTAGVPILFVGDVPYRSTGYLSANQNDKMVQDVFHRMLGRIRDVIVLQDKVQSGSAVFISDPANLGTALATDLQIEPDLILSDDIQFAHRQTASADYYFITTSRDLAFDTLISFPNNGGRFPQIFDLATGDVVLAPVYSVHGARTAMPLHLNPGGAAVVGFEASNTPEPPHIESTDIQYLKREQDGSITGGVLHPGVYSVTMNQETINVDIRGDSLASIEVPAWDLAVSGTDAHGKTISQQFFGVPLGDLSAVPQLSGFSGVATYTASVGVDNAYLTDDVHPILDLGRVYYAADVKVNDRHVARLVSSPFQSDLHDYLTPGQNQIEIEVTTSGTPSGLLGPAWLVPSYQRKVSAALPAKVPPVPLSVVVIPPNFPNSTPDDMLQSIGRAAQVTNHVNFQWYWKSPPTFKNPNGGSLIECDQVASWVKEARRLNLGVTLQFQVFVTQILANGSANVRIANPVVPFDQATFGNSTLADAYVKEVGCLAGLEPDYLVLGPEVNFLVAFNYPEFQRYQQVYLKAYDTVKSISPWTQVGLSWQYDGLRNSYLLDNWSYIAAAGPQDFVGLTTYYSYSEARFLEYSTVGSIPADYYRPIRERFPADVPIIFTEVGYSSAYPNGLANQADFMARFPALVKDVQPTMAVWALLHDVNYFVGAGAGLNQSGMLSIDDIPKPLWNKVKDMRAAGAITDVVPKVVRPIPLPFSVTSGPAPYPTTFTQRDGFDAIALGAQVSGHISMQFAWKDNVTGRIWNCEDISKYTDEAKRLGLKFTIQFNTYTISASAAAGQSPRVQVLTPVKPDNTDGQPLSMGMPEVRDAFLKQVACLAGLQPAYIVLGPDVNFLLGSDRPDEFNKFAEAYAAAYAAAKVVSPSTQIGVSFQYDAIRKSLLKNDPPWYISVLGPQDFIGFTTYFSFSSTSAGEFPTPLDIPRDYYDLIPVLTSKPVVFSQVGWGSYFTDGGDKQVAFLNRLPTLMGNIKPVNVIWALLQDTRNYFKDDLEPLNYFGLRTNEGAPKPAWEQALRLKRMGIYIQPPIK
ncbi:MAG TPA: glycosyl hydrolase, partial [Terriglobia bacterium]|nr:glycosyl hydrolase [Terriglobia bacterium]